ncbi:MAG: ABC transporter transmembrane domain-containing protein, partial [Acidobacteria bacterium]|nr:ABC transporter transmembrane domain-containing protein [Acidobacteriota bacterium]
MKGFASLFYIFKTFMKKHIFKFGIAVIFLAVGALFYAVEVYMIKFVFDDLLSPSSVQSGKSSFGNFLGKYFGNFFVNYDKESLFILIPVALVLIFFLKGLFNFFGKYYLDAVGLLAITDLRDSLYQKLLRQGQDFFSLYPTGTLISRLLNDVERMKTAVSEKLTEISTALFSLIALLISAFYQDYKLTFLSLVTIPLVVYPVSQFSKKLRRVSKKSQEEIATLADLMNETLSGVSIVQMFRMEEKESQRY